MKKTILALVSSIVALGLQAQTTFNGNGNTGFGGAVGLGNVVVNESGANLTFTLNRVTGNFNDFLVIYIDTVSGGFTTTGNFTDQGDDGRRATSGIGWDGRSTMSFTTGFLPDYAITIDKGYASLFQLADGPSSLTWITGTAQSGSATSASYALTIGLSQIGLTAGSGQTFGLFGTYTAASGYRSTEAVMGNDSGTQGVNPFTQTSYATFTIAAVPEPSTLALCGLSGLAALFVIRRRR